MNQTFFVLILIVVFLFFYHNQSKKSNDSAKEEKKTDGIFKKILFADDIVRLGTDAGKIIGTGLLA